MSEEIKNKDEKEQKGKKIIKQGITHRDLNKCLYADDYFLFDGKEGKPRYKDMEEKWNIFIEWIDKVAGRKKEEEGQDSRYAYQLGHEVVRWAKDRDVFALYILTRRHWVLFRDNYLTDDAPKIVREIIDGIMLNKMTEKEKWGTDEDRKPKGQLIIFKSSQMTPEESYRLRMKEKRRKYDPKKHAKMVAEQKNKLPEHEVWEL